MSIKLNLHRDPTSPNPNLGTKKVTSFIDPGIASPSLPKKVSKERRFSFVLTPDANKTQQTAATSLPIKRESGSV